MSTTLADLTAMLDEKFNPEAKTPGKVLTSYQKTRSWLKNRIRMNQQLLITAIVCSRDEMPGRLKAVERDIEAEFGSFIHVHPLPYPYDQVEQMFADIETLIEKYGGSFHAEDTKIVYEPEKEDNSPTEGYVILTIINSPIVI